MNQIMMMMMMMMHLYITKASWIISSTVHLPTNCFEPMIIFLHNNIIYAGIVDSTEASPRMLLT